MAAIQSTVSRPTVQATLPLHVLLPTVGSAGDVYPVVALGLGLQQRGHRATVLTNPFFQDVIEAQGLGFLPVGSLDDARATIADPDLWHPRKGFEVVARRAVLPSVSAVYRHIERLADSRTVVAASGMSFGARIAQERLGVPMATVHLHTRFVTCIPPAIGGSGNPSPATARASFGIYTTPGEIDQLVDSLEDAKRVFKV